MGHDHHFLERLDRVQDDQVEMALGLYRDHEAVRFVLSELNLPENVDRVALSIGGFKGPYVVIARNGHFVTCLGEGMTTGRLDVVPYPRLQALLAKHRDLKGRETTLATEQRHNEHTREFLVRMFRRGEALNREEFVAFSAFQPLMWRYLFRVSLEASTFVMQHVREFAALTKIKPAIREKAKLFHDEMWLTGHTTLLGTMGGREQVDELLDTLVSKGSRTAQCAMLNSTTLLLRGAWAASRFGKRGLANYRESLATEESNHMILDGVLGVLAIALVDDSARDEARQILTNMPKHARDSVNAIREGCAGSALVVLDDPEESGRVPALDVGRDIMLQRTAHLPEGDPYRYTKLEDVPDDVATTAALHYDGSWTTTDALSYIFMAIPLVVKSRAEDFYFPRELARRVVPDWVPELTLMLAARFKETLTLKQEPVRKTEPKVGRNDPCPCGSGKKYKKCHGA